MLHDCARLFRKNDTRIPSPHLYLNQESTLQLLETESARNKKVSTKTQK